MKLKWVQNCRHTPHYWHLVATDGTNIGPADLNTEHYCVHQAIGSLHNWPIYGNSSLCSSIESTSVIQMRQPPQHIYQINIRQVMQITYSALYKHLGLLSVTVYSCVSTSPNHIFFHKMYGNAIRTISTLDQFTHILPQAVYCITTPRYYFQGTTFISYWIFNTTIEEADYSPGIPSSDVGQSDIPPVEASSGQE